MGLKPWAKPAWLQDSSGGDMPYEQFLQLTGTAVTSLTDDPANDRTVAEIDTAAGGLQLDTTGWYNGAVTTSIPMDGNNHFINTTMNGAPSWYDGAHNITEKGIYAVSADLGVPSTAPTTPGLYLLLGGFQALWSHSVEELTNTPQIAPGQGFAVTADIEVFVVTGTPWDLGYFVKAQADATGVLTAQFSIQRIAY